MKRFIKIFAIGAISCLMAGACAKYDDSEIRGEIDKVEQELAGLEALSSGMQAQLSAINALVSSSFISYVSQDASGRTVICYQDKGGEVKTLSFATSSDVVTLPLISIAEFEGRYYWRQTTDNGKTYSWILDSEGNKIYAGGEKPSVEISADGYWVVAGVKTDVLATDMSNILFKSVEKDAENGVVVFTLADGTTFSVQLFEALGIEFSAPLVTGVPDYATAVHVKYLISGSQAAKADIDIFTAYNVDVTIDKYTKDIAVKMKEGALSGNVLIMVTAGETAIFKPLMFTYGSAVIEDPDSKYKEGKNIVLQGQMTEFEISVSHNIEYVLSISDNAKSWLIEQADTKGELITSKHKFVADYYEDASGLERKGTITLYSKLYDVTTSIDVIQMPVVPVGPTNPGITTPGDLVAFAKAVNSGASTSRWQNEAGEVVLLNDIDVSAISEWTPIGSGIGTVNGSTLNGYEMTNPFTGVFNGQGFAIKGINWTFDVSKTSTDLYGLFGAVNEAVIKNVVIGAEGDKITVTGVPTINTSVAPAVGYALSSTITGITNNVSVTVRDDVPEIACFAGVVGAIRTSTVGSKEEPCVNYGDVRTGNVTNVNAGGTGVQTAGVCAWICDGGSLVAYCDNYGGVSCPTGRTGGIVASMGGTPSTGSKIENCNNYGQIEDDVDDLYAGKSVYNTKRMGGIFGGTDGTNNEINGCTNYGNVFSHIGCRTGGIVGHNKARITGCVNKGIILSDITIDSSIDLSKNPTQATAGPGWCTGYTAAKCIFQCAVGGKVGEWKTWKDNPAGAPDATLDNTTCYKNGEYIDPSEIIQ